ncbi:uncharacterized protein [Parasteatoda tepidariorum]|uniref:uncharacterized protein n=1 Tax=Parasteatoda tepidariorum TaxID=114398 RepID=UPI00077F904B|nr:uncharacterized protein LOC107436240 [Parasteatoda tepidariorum]
MLDKELLKECLISLTETEDSKVSREAIETLLTIHRNIFHNEDNSQYRLLKPANPSFSRKIWSLYTCRQFMLLSGWIEVHGRIVFNSDENLLEVIELLLQFRDVAPLVSEWDTTTKYEGKSEAQLREEDLKRKAVLEREKEIAEYEKDKKYRDELAKNIKAQIKSDRRKPKQVFTKPVAGNQLKKGAKIKTLQGGH